MRKFLPILFFALSISVYSQDLIINEVMASNSNTIYDEDGDASDWLELFNSGSTQINLDGFYLSDDSTDIKKWRFGNTVISPGEYLLVFASDKDTLINYWHANFKISASGETLLLSDTSGSIVDIIDIPESLSDVSYGRKSDGSSEWIFQEPTPGSANSGVGIEDFSDSITVSTPGGFYSTTLNIELSAGTSDIYYTLDGHDPDTTSLKYSEPINITNTAVLRAVSIKANHKPFEIYESYFINDESDLPVISLITDPDNLFDYDYGIYADGPGWTPNPPHHGANFWMDWERPAHVQFYDDNKNLGFSENCGIEIYGGYTRSFPMKSMSVKFKDPYNSNSLEYPLFPGFYLNKFKSFILRNSGNDFQYTHFRDAMMQSLIKDLDIDYLEYRPAAAYINGEYWGIYNIREKISEHYVANRHNVNPDNIDMLEGNMEVIHGDSVDFQDIVDYISSNDMTTDEAYNYVNRKIDLENCLLYFASHSYFNSQDWPANNLKYWRERSENGKWRWIIFDLDFGFNLYETTGQSEDHIYYIFSGVETRPGSNPPWSTLLPRKLVENPKIKTMFVNLVADLLNTNFKSNRVLNYINDFANHISAEGIKHRQRWGINQFTYTSHIDRMKTFAEERPAYLRGFIRNFFESGSDGFLRISNSEGGKVKLNSIYIDNPETTWSGIYFMNNPVTLKAIPKQGYKFAGWSGDVNSTEDSITVSVSRSTNIKANFLIDSSLVNEIVINEINYNSADDFDSGDWIELYNLGNHSVDLSGWFLSDSDTINKFIIPDGTVIESNGYLVIVNNEVSFVSIFPNVQNFIGQAAFGLSGSGEFIELVNSDGEIIDSLTYDDKYPWPVEADGNGSSLELINAYIDNSAADNWEASDGLGTPGSTNSGLTSSSETDNSIIPESFSLLQNFPNPFNPTTNISFNLPTLGKVTLKIYDILGREIAVLLNEVKPAGRFTISWNAENFASGMYIYRIQAGKFSDTKKLILMK